MRISLMMVSTFLFVYWQGALPESADLDLYGKRNAALPEQKGQLGKGDFCVAPRFYTATSLAAAEERWGIYKARTRSQA
jgi:hypothetical protein